jgi:hypothetical protein
VLVGVLHAVTATGTFAQSDQEMRDEVNRIFENAEEKVSKNLQAYIEASKSPLSAARTEIADVIARLNKEGRSNLATEFQRRLNNLEETIQKKASNNVPIIAPPKQQGMEKVVRLLPLANLVSDSMRGKWSRSGDELVCDEVDPGFRAP